jgi:basic membrane protein A
MSSNNTKIYAGIVIALIIGVAVGWVIYPTMNPVSTDEMVSRTIYNAALDDLATAQTEFNAAIADAATDLATAQTEFNAAIADAATDLAAAQTNLAAAKSDLAAAEAELDALKAPKKVGLILATGGLGDKSFNDISFAGVQRVKDELGVDFDYVEPAAIAEYEGYQRDFAMSGEYTIIICVGFDQADALTIISGEYPDQNFAIVDMPVFMPNVASLLFAANEASFLVGVVAGMVTETGKVGFIGGMDDPLIWDFFEGYEAGAIWANPDVEVMYPSFVGSWGDPAKGKELAIGLIEFGVDAMYAAGGRSGLGALDAANERSITAFGVDACQCYLYPEIIASGTKRVDVAVYEVILSALLGTFEGGIQAGGLARSWTGLCRLPEEENLWEATYGFEHDPLPEGVIEKVIEARDLIIAGEITVPTGFD